MGVESIFVDSATAIAQRIEAGHYDLLSEVIKQTIFIIRVQV